MSFLSPLFALLGLLAIPILLLYMLKLRRQDVKVSSTLLWQMVVQDRQANIPWQRLRRNLLLFIQLLILAALVFALLRPAFSSDMISNAEVIVVLDASASMQATDVKPTRFEAAKKEIETIITNLPLQSELTLIHVTEQPTILIAHSNNKQEMRRALAAANVTSGEANWERGFALANSAISKPDHILLLISDGGLSQTTIPLYAEQIRYIPIGASAANIGVAAFSIAPSQEAGEIFVKVRNYGAVESSAILSIFRDEALLQAERIRIPAGADHIQIISDLPLETANYRARLSSDVNAENLDDYPLDNQAFIAFNPSTNQRILLVSAGNFFLERFLAALPNAEAYQVFPDDADAGTKLPTEGFSTYIYDGYVPDVLPDGGILLINPPANPLFDVGLATADYGQVTVLEHPLTQFVEWGEVQILQTRAVIVPSWAEILIDSDAGPLVFVGEVQSRRIAVLSFDLLDSDLPLQLAFPILFNNLLTYLNPPAIYDAPDGYQIGDAVQLKPGPGVEELGVTLPNGTEKTLSVDEYGATFLETQQTGLYTVAALPGGQIEQFAVNAFSNLESAIAPKENISLPGQNPVSDAPSQQEGLREIWHYLAMLALILLILEWWLYHRQNRFDLAKLWQRGQSQ